ncbi:MAG TPA: hypothetical protein VI566_00225 [Xanthomonadales bacterium]|nr:hypothetical protein [Xanthomonadales bacterium]
MTTNTFFLKDMRAENYREGLSPEEKALLDRYAEEMEQGPADGEMDITWMETGRGYYSHLHFLNSIEDAEDRDLYLQKLREDIDTRLSEDPNNYMVGRVRELVVGKV